MNWGHLRQAPAHHRGPLRKDERDEQRLGLRKLFALRPPLIAALTSKLNQCLF